MRSEVIMIAALLLVALPMTGCPTSPSDIRLGIWLFELSIFPDAQLAVNLLPRGESAHPDPEPPEADGLLSTGVWRQDASTFQYVIEFPEPNSTWTLVGTVRSPTSMDGEFFGTENGTWTATFLQ